MVLATQLYVTRLLAQEEGSYDWKEVQGEAAMLAFMLFMLTWILTFTFW